LRTAERYWFGSNIDAKDILQSETADCDVYNLYVQWIVEDHRYELLKANGLLKRLRALGTPLCLEMGSVKPGDYHAEAAIASLPTIHERVLALGHRISYIKQDEPITATYQAYDANGNLIHRDQPIQPLEETSFAMCKFKEAAQNVISGVVVGWIEAWPHNDLETIRRCWMQQDSWGNPARFLHLDVDWHAGSNWSATIALAKKYADDYKAPLGVYFAGYPHATDHEYQQDVLTLAHNCLQNHSDIDHICVQSWATRGEHGPQDIPNNVGQYGLIETLAMVKEEWQ